MLEGVKTDHKCPECGEKLQYDVAETENNAGFVTINIYCTNPNCEYYDWRLIDPIAKEIE